MSKPIGSGRKKRNRSEYELQLESMLRDKKKLDGSPYSEQSIKTFINGIVKLGSNYLGDEEMSNLKWLEEPTKIISFINECKNINECKYSLASKLAFYQSIIICLNATGIEDESLLSPYWNERDTINIARIAHYEQKKSFDTTNGKNQANVLSETKPEDILSMVDKMDTLSFNESNEMINH